MKSLAILTIAASSITFLASAASAVTTFTETFGSSASNWLTGASGAPTYNATGGIGDSGYISYTSTFTSGATGGFPGASPLQLLFRGNNAANASNGAFVGNWLADGAQTLTVSVRHNYASTLNLYARLDAGAGAAASLAQDPSFAIAPDTWTTLTIPIVNSNPPFVSFGAGTFSAVFGNVQNVQLGLYVPASTTFTNLKIDLDNVAIVTPEPASLGALALGATFLRRRRA